MNCGCAVALATFISTLLSYEIVIELVWLFFWFSTEASFKFSVSNISEFVAAALDL
jgi:hypothetical protein